MRIGLVVLAAVAGFTPQVFGALLYDNTSIDTLETVFFSAGPYTGLGDQIQLSSAGTATQAKVELFNNGVAGTFDAELDLFQAGSPLGASLGSFVLPGVSSTGGDVIDLTFNLGAGVAVPQNIVFLVSILNQSSVDMDLGVDLFAGPTVGSSDPTFLVAASAGPSYADVPSDANVYFQLSGTAVGATPEPASYVLVVAGLAIGFVRRQRRP